MQEISPMDDEPCPFCGSTFIKLRRLETCVCRNCGARGPALDCGYDAFPEELNGAELWNKRVINGKP